MNRTLGELSTEMSGIVVVYSRENDATSKLQDSVQTCTLCFHTN